MRRTSILATLATTLLVGSLTPAFAANGTATGQWTFPMVCDGATVTLTIGNGNWSAAYVSELDARFLPKATYFSITNAKSGKVLYEEYDAKPSAEDKADFTCTETVVDGKNLITFEAYGVLR